MALRMTERQVQDYLKNLRMKFHSDPDVEKVEPEISLPEDRMNKTEKRYCKEILNPSKYTGDLVEWLFEPVKFRLAKKTFYTPDFLVIASAGYPRIQFHEVKGGFVRDDAIVKFKVAREMFPWFSWRMVMYKNGAWRGVL